MNENLKKKASKIEMLSEKDKKKILFQNNTTCKVTLKWSSAECGPIISTS